MNLALIPATLKTKAFSTEIHFRGHSVRYQPGLLCGIFDRDPKPKQQEGFRKSDRKQGKNPSRTLRFGSSIVKVGHPEPENRGKVDGVE